MCAGVCSEAEGKEEDLCSISMIYNSLLQDQDFQQKDLPRHLSFSCLEKPGDKGTNKD